MDAKRLGSQRNLTNYLDSSRGRRQRRGCLQQLCPSARGDGQLEAREEGTDDHRLIERMFAREEDGTTYDAAPRR
jgi:hypothetical protein